MKLKYIHSYKVTTVVTLIILAAPIIFFGTTAQMIHVWNVNETFTHGYLIFPIALWLIWNKRQQLSQFSIEPELRPILLLVMILLFWFLGNVVDVQVVKQLAMIGIIPILVWVLLGRAMLLATLFPVCYLFFAVPIGQGLIPPMMDFTANFTVILIQLSGIPIYREGLFFELPSGSWSVVEECSGVRYLIASLALGTLYAHITYQSLRKKITFVIIAALVPIIANTIRAYGIVMIGHLSGMKLATGVDHLIYGWLFFGIIIFTMFYLGSYWSDKSIEPKSADITSKEILLPNKKKPLITAVTVSLLVIIGVKSTAYQISQPIAPPVMLSSFSLPRNFEAWQSIEDVNIGWSPIFHSPDIAQENAYRFGSDIVQVNIAYYFQQREGAEAVSTLNRITNPISGRWKLTRRIDMQIKNHYVTESEIRRGKEKILAWHWYRMGNMQTPNAYIAKTFEAYNTIIFDRRDAAMITIATRLSSLKEARARLQSFSEVFVEDISLKLEALSN